MSSLNGLKTIWQEMNPVSSGEGMDDMLQDTLAGVISLKNVVKTYENPAGSFTALKGIDFEVGKGEFVSIVGKSGSGKSTLINMMTGIDRPSSGEVLVNGCDLSALNESELAKWRGRSLGIVFQFFQLLPTLTLEQNVKLPMDFCNTYTVDQRHERAMALLDIVGMQQHAKKLPSAVSGGQQQRVAIARALANDPPMMIADEPTGNLDSQTTQDIINLFHCLVDDGKTIVVVTHDNDVAQCGQRLCRVSDGMIVEDGNL